MNRLRCTLFLSIAPMLIACGGPTTFHPVTPADVAAGSPLGASYMLVPLPNDDEALLGRVLLTPPADGRSLDEVSRPNECALKLTEPKPGPLASTFEDAQELAGGGRARATLGTFGFEGDAQSATHFYYKLEVTKRVARTDTPDYVACCKEKGTCGYGFVSALIYGDGEYATAAESSAAGSISIPIAASAGGFVSAKVLHKRKVHGYVAALITVTDAQLAKPTSVLGDPAAAGIVVEESTLPAQVKERYEIEKIQLVDDATTGARFGWVGSKIKDREYLPRELRYVFKDGNGFLTENEFGRRYAILTGSNELDPVVTRRNTAGLLVWGGLTVLSYLLSGVPLCGSILRS